MLFRSQKGAMVLHVLTDEIAEGGGKEFAFRVPVEKQEPLELQLEVVDAENVKEVRRIKRVFLDVDYKAMALQLVNPWYRNSIYPTENIAELKMVIRLALAPKVLSGSRLQVRLLGEKATGLVSEVELRGLSNIEEVSLPIGDIVPGRYVIEAQIVGATGDIVAKTSQVLKKLRHEEHEWRLNSNGALLHNGEPFLPKGWFGIVPGEMQLMSGSPYNVLDRKSTRLNSSHIQKSRMPSSA